MKKGERLADTVANDIIRLILDRKMDADEKLPNEYELAAFLGVGRSTLREAIRLLVSRNVLYVRQGAGTFVSGQRGVPEDPLGLTFLGDDRTVALELLDIRLMLEPGICALAAQRASEEQLQELRRCCTELADRIDTGDDYFREDERFHRFLAVCSGNKVLGNLIPTIISSVSINIRATADESRELTRVQHLQIAEAICRRDAVGAQSCMVAHLNTSREIIARTLSFRDPLEQDPTE